METMEAWKARAQESGLWPPPQWDVSTQEEPASTPASSC